MSFLTNIIKRSQLDDTIMKQTISTILDSIMAVLAFDSTIVTADQLTLHGSHDASTHSSSSSYLDTVICNLSYSGRDGTNDTSGREYRMIKTKRMITMSTAGMLKMMEEKPIAMAPLNSCSTMNPSMDKSNPRSGVTITASPMILMTTTILMIQYMSTCPGTTFQ